MSFQTNQVAEIIILATGQQPASRGTGYLIFPHCVLTALHVVKDRGERPIHVRLLGHYADYPQEWPLASVVWEHQAFDLAVLKYPGESAGEVMDSSIKRLNFEKKQACCAYGFPGYNQLPGYLGRERDLEVLEGWIKPLESPKSPGRLQIENEGASPGTMEAWKGMSGAPVFADNALVGVVLQGLTALNGQRLEAIALDHVIKSSPDLNTKMRQHFSRELSLDGSKSVRLCRGRLRLNGRQRKQLSDALMAAFPTPESLRRMLSAELDVQLNTITGAGSYLDQLFDVVEWINAQGLVEALLQGAIAFNPSSPELEELASEWLK